MEVSLRGLRQGADLPRYAGVHVLAIIGMTVAVSVLHYLTPDEALEKNYLIQRLFYIPVVYAGLYFG